MRVARDPAPGGLLAPRACVLGRGSCVLGSDSPVLALHPALCHLLVHEPLSRSRQLSGDSRQDSVVT